MNCIEQKKKNSYLIPESLIYKRKHISYINEKAVTYFDAYKVKFYYIACQLSIKNPNFLSKYFTRNP
jgi:hypothetical protein